MCLRKELNGKFLPENFKKKITQCTHDMYWYLLSGAAIGVTVILSTSTLQNVSYTEKEQYMWNAEYKCKMLQIKKYIFLYKLWQLEDLFSKIFFIPSSSSSKLPICTNFLSFLPLHLRVGYGATKILYILTVNETKY